MRFQSTDHDTGFIGGTQQLCPALTPCSLIHFEASNRKCPFCSWVASASFLDAVTKIPEKASAVVLTTTKATQREEFIKLTAPSWWGGMAAGTESRELISSNRSSKQRVNGEVGEAFYSPSTAPYPVTFVLQQGGIS